MWRSHTMQLNIAVTNSLPKAGGRSSNVSDPRGRSGGSQFGTERSMVRDNTRPGEEASVWDPLHPHESDHGRHTDADLYRHEQSGRVTRIDRAHVPDRDRHEARN